MSITGCVFALSPKPALSTLSDTVITLKAISECCLFCALVSPTQWIQKGTGLFDSVYFIARERDCVCLAVFVSSYLSWGFLLKLNTISEEYCHCHGFLKSHIEPMECGSNLVVEEFIRVSALVMFLFTLDFHLFTHSSLPPHISYTVIITSVILSLPVA